MQKVNLHMTEDKRLVVKTESGEEYFINIFNGGGYYTDLWLQTQQDLDRITKEREEREKRELEDYRERQAHKKGPGLIERLLGGRRQR